MKEVQPMKQAMKAVQNLIFSVAVFAVAVLFAGFAGFASAQDAPAQCSGLRHSDMPIPDNGRDTNMLVSTIAISVSEMVADVSVFVDIRHTYMGDLSLALTSPTGTAITLHNRMGGSDDNIIRVFTMSSTSALAMFAGENPMGDWVLSIGDWAALDTGTLRTWALAVRTSSGACMSGGELPRPPVVVPGNNGEGRLALVGVTNKCTDAEIESRRLVLERDLLNSLRRYTRAYNRAHHAGERELQKAYREIAIALQNGRTPPYSRMVTNPNTGVVYNAAYERARFAIGQKYDAAVNAALRNRNILDTEAQSRYTDSLNRCTGVDPAAAETAPEVAEISEPEHRELSPVPEEGAALADIIEEAETAEAAFAESETANAEAENVEPAPAVQEPASAPSAAKESGSPLVGIGGGIAALGLALHLWDGSPDAFAFSPNYGYAFTEGGHSYNYGARVDFAADKWRIYWTAGQGNVNGDFGDLQYASGVSYQGDFWRAAFSESAAGDVAEYDFALSAEYDFSPSARFGGGVWKLSPTYRFHSRLEEEDGGGYESDSANSLSLAATMQYHRWQIRPSAGFQWRNADEFGDTATFRISVVRRF